MGLMKKKCPRAAPTVTRTLPGQGEQQATGNSENVSFPASEETHQGMCSSGVDGMVG